MPADEPSWWYAPEPTTTSDRLRLRLLQPVSRVWSWAAERRFRTTTPYRATLPVICVGNFTAGGTGKTPLSIHLARTLQAHGEVPAFLTRGYRGRHRGPRRVDPGVDTADDIGDEALLLARAAPTVVARERAKGAAMLATFAGLSPPSVIVMDDGLQNPGLAKDLAIAVVDGRRGFGNGRVIPAGPLRADLAFQLGLADAIVVNRPAGDTDGENAIAGELRQRFPGPVLEASVAPDGDIAALAGARVVAFAGIANPARFYDLLSALGADVVERLSYPDHHTFSEVEAAHILARATALDARIMTTEKDRVRLVPRFGAGSGALAVLRDRATPLPIRLSMSERDTPRLASLLDNALATRRALLRLTDPRP